MTDIESLLLIGLFIVLAIGVVFFRKSIAIICWLISGHIDLGLGAIAGVMSQFTLLNSVKILGFPSWLFLRLRRDIRSEFRLNIATVLWLAFIGYAAISLLWTPDRLVGAGIKQIGYFVAYSIGYIVLFAGWRNGVLTAKSIIVTIVAVSVLAIIQTYVLGNAFGVTLNYTRYVSFTSKQQFGEFLFVCIVFMLFVPNVKIWLRSSILLVLWAQLFLNGSRAGVLGAIAALIIFLLGKKGVKGVFAALAIVIVGLTTYLAKDSIYDFVDKHGKGSRVYELVDATKKKGNIKSVGTVKARLEFWMATLDHMDKWAFKHKLFGKGVSSSGLLVNESYFSRLQGRNVLADPNRTMHNELLRTAFEYGLIGLLIFMLFISSMFLYSLKRDVPKEAKLMMLAFAPGLMLFLAIENIFTGSGAAGGIGFIVVISYVSAARFSGLGNRA